MVTTEFTWKTAAGAGIYAVEWKPEGRARGAVALVHGFGEHSRRYDHVAEAFTKAGYALVGFDLPGFGRSEGKRGCASYALILEQIDILLEETRRRFPGLPLVLYGHSMGGAAVILHLLERKPALTGAIATGPLIALAAPVSAPKALLARVMAGIMPELALPNPVNAELLSHDPEVGKAYLADPLVTPMVSTRLGLDIMELEGRLLAGAGGLTVPLLLVHGTEDGITDPRASLRFAETAGALVTFRPVEGGFHELHNEPDKEKLFALELAWMEGLAKQAR